MTEPLYVVTDEDQNTEKPNRKTLATVTAIVISIVLTGTATLIIDKIADAARNKINPPETEDQ